MKRKDIFIYAFIFLIISINTFSIKILPYDELWNFMNVIKISKNIGALYSDANIIVTPLFFIISSIFVKIFGEYLITFRILDIIIKFVIFIEIKYIAKKITNNNKKSYIISMIYVVMLVIFKMANGANYNELSFLFVLLGTFCYLNEKKSTIKYQILHGFIIYLIFMTKQNIGLYYIIGTTVIDFIINKSKIEALKKLSLKAVTFIILTLISIFIMHILGILNGFIDYSILGIGDFRDNFYITHDTLLIIKILIIYLLFFILFMCYVIKNKFKIDKNYIIMCVMSLCMFMYAFPIVNKYHIYIGSILYLTFCLSFIFNLLSDIISNKIINILFIFSIILCILSLIYIMLNIFKSKDEFHCENVLSELKYTFISDDNLNEIYVIKDYIDNINKTEKKCVMLNYKSVYSFLSNDLTNGILDLVLVGNLGKNRRRKNFR